MRRVTAGSRLALGTLGEYAVFAACGCMIIRGNGGFFLDKAIWASSALG